MSMTMSINRKLVEAFKPAQRPGKSEQTVETPEDFLKAVRAKFGPLTWDLAATAKNKKAPNHLGPGSPTPDSLTTSWANLTGNLWLNPPYSDLGKWAAKCAAERLIRHKWSRILLLTPASVGSNWWVLNIHQKATVYFLSPRLTFVGHTQSYPKDLALSVYCTDSYAVEAPHPGYECWRWKL
jgi:hypothetical protein